MNEEDPMMSLFDSDSNLLDEITGLNTGFPAPSLGPDLGAHAIDQLIPPVSQQQQPLQQQHLQQQSFIPMQSATLPHQNMAQGIRQQQTPPQSQQPQQRLHHIDDFNFGASSQPSQKLHHISDPPAAAYMQNMTPDINNAPIAAVRPQFQQSTERFTPNIQANQPVSGIMNDFNPMWSQQNAENANAMNANNPPPYIPEQSNPNYQVPPYLTHHGHDYALPPGHVQAQQRQQQVQQVQQVQVQQQVQQLQQQVQQQVQPQVQQQQVQPQVQQQQVQQQVVQVQQIHQQQPQRYIQPFVKANQGNGYISPNRLSHMGPSPVNTHHNHTVQSFPPLSHSQGVPNRLPAPIQPQLPNQIQQSPQPPYPAMHSGANLVHTQRTQIMTRMPNPQNVITQQPNPQTVMARPPNLQNIVNQPPNLQNVITRPPNPQNVMTRPPNPQNVMTYNQQVNALSPRIQTQITTEVQSSGQIQRNIIIKLQPQQFRQRPAMHQGEQPIQRMLHFTANPHEPQRQPEPQFMQNFTPSPTNLPQRSMVPRSLPPPSLIAHSMPSPGTSQGNFINLTSNLQQLENLVPPVILSNNSNTETLANPFDIAIPSGQTTNMQPLLQPPQPSASSTFSPGYTVTTTASVANQSVPARSTANVMHITTPGQNAQIINPVPSQPTVQPLSTSPQEELLSPAIGTSANLDDEPDNRLVRQRQAQAKANRICAEAMAKAQAAGLQSVPRVVHTPESPATTEEIPKPKPKEIKKEGPKLKPKKTVLKKKPISRKPPPKPIIIRRFGKKRIPGEGESSDNGSDLEETPPPSPEDGDGNSLKRRSSRNTGGKRKRYTDDYDYNISDEDKDVDVEGLSDNNNGARFIQPAKFFVENPDESESFIVDRILSIRRRKKEQIPGEAQVGDIEEFYVKYKNL